MKKIFVLGIMFVFAFTISAQNREKGGRGPGGGDMSKRYEELKKELSLNEQQVDSVKAIDKEFFDKMREQREQNRNDREKGREEVEKMNDQRNERIKALLTED